MWLRRLITVGLLILNASARAQQPAPPGMSLAEAAARRFPQPVVVGSLLKRDVLQPLPSMPVLGRVREVVTQPDGTINVVVNYGGVFGLFSRPIAVPVDAMVLVGQYMSIVDFTPAQLDKFKTFEKSSGLPVPADSIIRVGLARPSH